MFFIFGSRLWGKVDEVPGLFHVGTRFGHINFVPLIPMQSYVILSQDGGSVRGVQIPLSGKSILIAWGRAVGALSAIIAGIAGLVTLSSRGGGEQGAMLLGLAAFGAGLYAFLKFYKSVTHA